MSKSVKLRALKVALLFALAIFSGSSALADDTQDRMEQAYIQGDLTVQEAVAKKDSVFALINQRYQSVKPILENSCFDCHSQSTDYPWYHNVPLIEGMMDDHIAEGVKHLDMSQDFPFAGKEDGLKLLGEIKEEIEEEEMPLFSYRLLHWGKLIEGEKRDSLFAWIDETTVTLNDFFKGIASDSLSDTGDTD